MPALSSDWCSKVWLWDAAQKMQRIAAYLHEDDRILEVGCGPGSVCYLLRRHGHNVTPLDVRDLSFSADVRPVLYDGHRMPFDDASFDVALLLTVLHHPNPRTALREAQRVARRLVIIEDVYSNRAQRWLTCFADSLMNLEFSGHPHANHSDAGWRRLFDDLGLVLVAAQSCRFPLFFRQATYYLERAGTRAAPKATRGLGAGA